MRNNQKWLLSAILCVSIWCPLFRFFFSREGDKGRAHIVFRFTSFSARHFHNKFEIIIFFPANKAVLFKYSIIFITGSADRQSPTTHLHRRATMSLPESAFNTPPSIVINIVLFTLVVLLSMALVRFALCAAINERLRVKAYPHGPRDRFLILHWPLAWRTRRCNNYDWVSAGYVIVRTHMIITAMASGIVSRTPSSVTDRKPRLCGHTYHILP